MSLGGLFLLGFTGGMDWVINAEASSARQEFGGTPRTGSKLCDPTKQRSTGYTKLRNTFYIMYQGTVNF